jgi:hypothetical protein
MPNTQVWLWLALVAAIEKRRAYNSSRQIEWNTTRTTIYQVEASKTADHLGLRLVSSRLLLCNEPDVTLKHVGKVCRHFFP